jgi:hypothetical protein
MEAVPGICATTGFSAAYVAKSLTRKLWFGVGSHPPIAMSSFEYQAVTQLMTFGMTKLCSNVPAGRKGAGL